MTDRTNSLLEDDHESLDLLLAELEDRLANGVESSIELLDLLWARLAVHIRAEHLEVFPALADVPAIRLTGAGGLPTIGQLQDALSVLRNDHDFFMRQLAKMMNSMREKGSVVDFQELRQRLNVLKERLADHNQLEEEQVYVWPSLLFDQQTLEELSQRVRTELKNLPSRFS